MLVLQGYTLLLTTVQSQVLLMLMLKDDFDTLAKFQGSDA